MCTLIKLFKSAQNYCGLCKVSMKQLSGTYGLTFESFRTSSTFRSLSVNECMERTDLERWTKPEHISAAILPDQSNAEHREFTHFMSSKKFGGSGMICIATMVCQSLLKESCNNRQFHRQAIARPIIPW